MSKLREVFTLQELLEATKFIQENKETVKKALKAGKLEELELEGFEEKLEQLTFYFDAGFSQEDIIENIEEIYQGLSKIRGAEKSHPPENYSTHVPKQFLEYWQREAEMAAKSKEEAARLVEQRIAAWIAGLKEKYARERKAEVTPTELIRHLESQKKKIETWLERDEKKIQKILSPFEKVLTKEIEKLLPPQTPKETIKSVARETAEVLSRLPEIKDKETFREKLAEVLEKAIFKIEALRAYLPKEKIPEIVGALLKFYQKIYQALGLRGELNLKIGLYLDIESATNPPLEKPPEAIAEQLQPPPGRTIKDVWNEITSWWYTQGYPFQTLLALIKTEPGIFKGGAREVIKNIKDALLPGFPLRSQLLIILSAGAEELAIRGKRAIMAGYEQIFGEGSFERDFETKFGEDWSKVALGVKGYLGLIEDGVLTEIRGKEITFEQKEKLALYVHLLENIEKLEKFAKAHPYLAGSLRAVGKVFAFPVRHQKITLLYQLSKTGAYAPRVFVEFLAREGAYLALRAIVVKLTERFWWGWKTKYVPFVGYKVVWKPAEWVKTKVKEKLAKVFEKVLTKLGLKKLVSIIAGGGIIGFLIIVFKEPIKKALKAIGALFLALLHFVAQYGPGALAIFGLSTLAGIGGGIALGVAKGVGILATLVFGAVGGVIGAVIGGGLVYLWATKVLPWWHSLTAPITAPAAATVEAAIGEGALAITNLTPYAAIAPASLAAIGTLAAGTLIITSSAFVIPVEEKQYGSKYIQIQKGFDINGERQTTTIFEYDDIKNKTINYAIKVTIVEKTLTNVVVNDKLEIIGEQVIEYHNLTWDKSNSPELAEMNPGDSITFEYKIENPDERFQDAYISNTVTVTSDEGETQTLTLTLTVGQPPVPESVFLIRKIVDTLLACPGLPKGGNGVVVNETTWPTAKDCLEKAGIPGSIVTLFADCTHRYYNLQCVCFLQAVTLPGKNAAWMYCQYDTPGYPLTECRRQQACWNNIQEGDIIASDDNVPGHVAMVVRPPVKNSKGDVLYVEVGEAIGSNGAVQYRWVSSDILRLLYCGYLRKE